jgi:hypothetical protein
MSEIRVPKFVFKEEEEVLVFLEKVEACVLPILRATKLAVHQPCMESMSNFA